MAWSYNFDITTPAFDDDPSEADDRMREIKGALQERLNVEHVFDLTGNEVSHLDSGKHTDITTLSITNAGVLIQTGNLILNTDKFTVDAATGNVVVAGTLAVAGIATLGDGSKLATSAAPGADVELANKKYVDDQITIAIAAAIAAAAISPDPMTGGTDSNGTVTFPNGLIYKWGKQAIAGGFTAVTFDTPFPNACFQAFANGGTSTPDPDEVATRNISVNGFTLQHSTQTNLVRWFAIGR